MLIGAIQPSCSVVGDIGQACRNLAGRDSHRNGGNGLPADHIKRTQLVQVGNVQGLLDQHHSLGGVERNPVRAALDELKIEDLSVSIEFGDEAVIVCSLRVAIDARNKVFLPRAAADEAVGSLEIGYRDLRPDLALQHGQAQRCSAKTEIKKATDHRETAGRWSAELAMHIQSS